MTEIKDVLISLGYVTRDFGKSWRCKPLYRESDNNTSLSINKENGRWIDFGTAQTGNFHSLVQLTLGLKSPDEAKEMLKNNFNFTPVYTNQEPQIKQVKKFPSDLLVKLLRDNSYWNNRKISNVTLDTFKGGVSTAGKMKDRYVFPVFDPDGALIGATGRSLIPNPTIKWKIIGPKMEFVYPLFANKSEIRALKRVILVESIGDMLSLWEAGVKNVLVCFGIEIGIGLLNGLLRLD